MPKLSIGLVLVMAAGTLLVAGCGGGSGKNRETLPRSSVQALEKQLDSVEGRLAAGGGACNDMLQGSDSNVDSVRGTLNSLPASVDSDVRDALRQSFDRLWELASSQCDKAKNQRTTPLTTPQPTTPTETTPPTNTTPTPTDTAPTPTDTTPQKPKKPKGKGNGGGGAGDGGAG